MLEILNQDINKEITIHIKNVVDLLKYSVTCKQIYQWNKMLEFDLLLRDSTCLSTILKINDLSLKHLDTDIQRFPNIKCLSDKRSILVNPDAIDENYKIVQKTWDSLPANVDVLNIFWRKTNSSFSKKYKSLIIPSTINFLLLYIESSDISLISDNKFAYYPSLIIPKSINFICGKFNSSLIIKRDSCITLTISVNVRNLHFLNGMIIYNYDYTHYIKTLSCFSLVTMSRVAKFNKLKTLVINVFDPCLFKSLYPKLVYLVLLSHNKKNNSKFLSNINKMQCPLLKTIWCCTHVGPMIKPYKGEFIRLENGKPVFE